METAVATALPPGSSQPALQQVAFSKVETDRLLSALAKPFDPGVIKWVVKATSSKDGKRRGLVAAYADPRAYSDRLNQLLTPSGWTQEYSMHVVQDFQRKNGGKENVPCAKVMVICRVTIFGLNSHSGTGEQWADNDNALTGADAQAFKRACSCFGLGRYLYSLPQVWVELNEFKQPRRLPDLPAWALPQGRVEQKATRNGSGPDAVPQNSKPQSANGNQSNSSGRASNGRPVTGRSGNGTNEFRQVLIEIQQLSKPVGRKLFGHVLRTCAGVDNLNQVADIRKLKLIRDQLQNVQRGTLRLKALVGTVGLEALREECTRLQLPGFTSEDIPDTKTLRKLIECLETKAKQAQAAPRRANGDARHQSQATQN
jgi:hypothetical protein